MAERSPSRSATEPSYGGTHTPKSGFVEHQIDGLAILLWASDPNTPHRLATPFFHGAAAAAMDIAVEIYFTSASVALLVPGVADSIRPNPNHPKSVLDSIREATDLGARLFACSDALVAHGLDGQILIEECAGRGGAVQFMMRAANLRWRTLVF